MKDNFINNTPINAPMDSKSSFFSSTKEKIYVVAVFICLRFMLGFLGRTGFHAKIPAVISAVLSAIDFIVSLPMKLVFATPAAKLLTKYQFGAFVLFVLMIAYWYLFASILVYAYENLNKQSVPDIKESIEEQKPEEMQSKLV